MVYHRRSWKVFWIVVTQGTAASGRRERARRDAFRGADRLPGDLQLHAPRGARARRARGFRVTDVAVDHVFPYRIRDYVEYRYVKQPYFRWMPEPLFRALRAPVRLAPAHHGGAA